MNRKRLPRKFDAELSLGLDGLEIATRFVASHMLFAISDETF
jgi:hypothetical protein